MLLCCLFWLAGMGPARAADSVPIRLAGVDHLGDIPTVIAAEAGLFDRQGLDVVVEFSDSGRHNLQRLRAGEVDFALMALTPIVLDRLAAPSRGAADDPVILASLVHSIRLNHLVVPASGPVQHPADLQGRRVGLHQGTNAEFAWWLFAHFNGLDPNAVETVDYAVDRINDALREGEVDAALVWEPWLSRLQEHGGEAFRSMPGSQVYGAKWVLVTTRATARGEPELCRAMLAAYRDAIAAIDRDPNGAIAVYARHAGINEEILRRNWQALDYDLNLHWSILATLQQQIDWAVEAGHGQAADSIGVLDLVDAAALRALDPALVGIPEDSAHYRLRP